MRRTTNSPRTARWRWLALLAAAGCLLAMWRLLPLAEWIETLVRAVSDRGAAGVGLFFLAYVVATLAMVPGSLMTMAAGAIYGAAEGAAIGLASATAGATLAFLLARFVARDSFARFAERHDAWRAIDAAIRREDWKVIVLVRLSPVVPFNLSNYLFGLSQARLGAYVIATACGMIPGAVLYAYLGYAGRTALESGRSTEEWALLGVGLVATAAIAWRLTTLARRELAKRDGGEGAA